MSSSWIDHPGKVAIVGSIIILVGQFGATIFPIMLGPDLSDYNLLCDPIYQEITPPAETAHNFSINHYDFKDNNSKIHFIELWGSPLNPNFEFNHNKPYRIYVKNITGYQINISKDKYNSVSISNIYLVNIHPIHRYLRQVLLTISCPPGFNASLSSPIVTIDQPITLYIKINLTYLLKNNREPWVIDQIYPVLIQGIGADGKRRNCTIIMEMKYLDKPISIIRSNKSIDNFNFMPPPPW